MANVAVYNMEGKEVGTIELSDAIFGAEVNEHLVHLAVVQYLADQRQGTQKAKTRAEVSGGGRKPWRQKGTGHARQGSTRSPQWRHGGIVFAPKPRSYRQLVNKKVRRLAMKSAFSVKVAENSIIVLDKLEMEEIKTKKFVELLNNLKIEEKALFVLAEPDDVVMRSARNLPRVQLTLVNTLNVYDIMNNGKFVVTADAVKKIEEVFA